MSSKAARIVAVLLISSAPCLPQGNRGPQKDVLYIVAATPTLDPKGPVLLYRIDPGNSPSLVRSVLNGVESVLADYDRRKLVVAGPPITPTRFSVIDMDKPAAPVLLEIPYDTEKLAPGAMLLLDLPNGSTAIALALCQMWKKPFIYPQSLKAVRLEHPQSRPEDLPFENFRYVQLGGRAGAGLDDGKQASEVAGDPLRILLAGPGERSTRLRRPAYLNNDPPGTRYWLTVNSESVGVLVGGPRALDVLNKRSGQWRRVAIPSNARRVRAFGSWITAILEEPGWYPAQPHHGTIFITPADQEKIEEFRRKNRGAAKRQTEVIDHKLTVDDFFDGIDATYPGELFVYNAESGATLRISTGEADSEVILVSDDAVFYRVNDELYRAAISGSGLGSPVKLAEGEEIFQVHWAFLSAK